MALPLDWNDILEKGVAMSVAKVGIGFAGGAKTKEQSKTSRQSNASRKFFQPIAGMREAINRSLDPVWKFVQKGLLTHYGEDIFKSWFMKLSLGESSGNHAILIGSTGFACQRIKEQYLSAIQDLWKKETCRDVDITVMMQSEYEKASGHSL